MEHVLLFFDIKGGKFRGGGGGDTWYRWQMSWLGVGVGANDRNQSE